MLTAPNGLRPTKKALPERTPVIPNTWISADDGSPGVIRAPAVDIDAPMDWVWTFIQDQQSYATLYAKTLPLDGKAHKRLKILQEATPIVRSNSRTSKSIYWSKNLPLSYKVAERFHVLVPLGPNKTRSYLAARIPGVFGKLCSKKRDQGELKALTAINYKLKEESEKSVLGLLGSFLNDLIFLISNAKAIFWRLSGYLGRH